MQVIISHGGNGLGLFIKDLVPDAIHIGYFEWYFDRNNRIFSKEF